MCRQAFAVCGLEPQAYIPNKQLGKPFLGSDNGNVRGVSQTKGRTDVRITSIHELNKLIKNIGVLPDFRTLVKQTRDRYCVNT